MTADDFEVRKVDTHAYPWAIVHKASGKYLPVAATVDLQDGPTTTTFVYHRTRREALAALRDHFAAAKGTA
jgi:hypothetical protein